MNKVKGYTKLPNDEYSRLMEYICYERYLIYLFENHYHFKKYPLLYLDRNFNWEKGNQLEPLENKYNGFKQFMENQIITKTYVNIEELEEKFKQLLSKGQKVQIYLWENGKIDNKRYLSTTLVEDFDDLSNVYITKFNGDMNIVKKKVRFKDFLNRLYLVEDNHVKKTELDIFSIPEPLTNIDDMNDLDAFMYIFKSLFGYSLVNNKIHNISGPITVSNRGVEDLITYYEENYEEVMRNNIEPPIRVKLSRLINNKVIPIQYFYKYVIESPYLSNILNSKTIGSISEIKLMMEISLKNILKYASLLIHSQTVQSYESYLKALKEFQGKLELYQKEHLKLISELIKEGEKVE